jgi:hypothetical protein
MRARVLIKDEREVPLYRGPGTWFGVLDLTDDTITAIFWSREMAEEFCKKYHEGDGLVVEVLS